MIHFELIIFVTCLVWRGIQATAAPVFNLQTCDGGCQSQNDCPKNSACIPVIGQTCGLCLCTVGYTLVNKECVATGNAGQTSSFGQQVPPKNRPTTTDTGSSDGDDSESDNSNGQGQTVTANGSGGGVNSNSGGGLSGGVSGPSQQTSQAPSSQTSTVGASNADDDDDQSSGGASANGGSGNNSGGGGDGFDCNKYKCDNPSQSNGKDCSDAPPSTIQCPNLAGGGKCLLGSCLKVNATVSYCLCPYGRQSRSCQVKKPGNCNQADGKLPSDAVETKGKRFRHIRDPENGAVLARHSVDSLQDCVKLCQWATYQQCRSINYGTINGQKICELLTVWANKESILYQWLKDEPDWEYVCCFK